MDSALKQRLIGAVVLVALAVIFLPMLIKGPAPDSGVADVSLQVPDAPDSHYETRELPLVGPGATPSGGAVGMQGGGPATVQGGTPTSPAPAQDGGRGSMLPPETAAGGFAVSFGAYATIADAETVIERLEQARLPGYREPTTINDNVAYRVRIGPFADRAAAEAARLQASRIRADVRAQVLALDAPTATGSTAAAAPAGGATSTAPLASNASADAAELRDSPAAAAAPVARPVATPAAPAATPRAAAAPTAVVPAPTAPAATPRAPAPAAAAGVGFAVQLGAFASASDASALRDKLRASGFSAFVQTVQTDKGTLNRVRVGPVSSRADADQLRAEVAAKAGMSGLVISHP